jgi:crotonobetainyl-CoA:carnitine CoA-transferase CaiB-like acyl-CoA transferase
MLSGRYACYQTYRAGDGRWLAVGALEPKFWAALCSKLGCPEFIPDQFAEGARQAEIIESLRGIFRTKSAAEWLELFRGADVCVTLVQNVAEVAADRGSEVIPKLSDTPGRAGDRPPGLDEH